MENKCKHFDCQNLAHYRDLCQYHLKGGILATGETYEQYQVIEEDFINFIKIIPLYDSQNWSVSSPDLRDIIIRCSVQIEIVFKEWAKNECLEDNTIELFKVYNSNAKGVRNWNMKHYHYFKEKYLLRRELYVRDLDKKINPFQDWEAVKPPKWWDVYNLIKHGGFEAKKDCTLEVVLDSMAALFLLHCCNKHTRQYLEQFTPIIGIRKGLRNTQINFDKIKTPLDSKKYLFSDNSSSRVVKTTDEEEINNRASGKGRSV